MGAERTERTERRSVIRVRVIINLGGEEINQNHRPPVCEGQQLLRMMFATSKTPLRVSTLHWNRRGLGREGLQGPVFSMVCYPDKGSQESNIRTCCNQDCLLQIQAEAQRESSE